MPSLSDQLLAGGCAAHVRVIHGEPILILDGPDAGKTFTGIREIEPDSILSSELGEDPRARVMLRFNLADPQPAISSQTRLRTDDGKVWRAVKQPQSQYLTQDYELLEVSPKDT